MDNTEHIEVVQRLTRIETLVETLSANVADWRGTTTQDHKALSAKVSILERFNTRLVATVSVIAAGLTAIGGLAAKAGALTHLIGK